MKTCAECRFWNRSENYHAENYAECLKHSDHNPLHEGSKVYVYMDYYAVNLHTASDFGCVQFEQLESTIKLRGTEDGVFMETPDGLKQISGFPTRIKSNADQWS